MPTGRLAISIFVLLRLLAAQPAGSTAAAVQRHLAAARQAEQSGDYKTASAEYEELTRLVPNEAGVHQSLALAYHLENHFAQAIPEFNRALDLNPNLWGALLFLGVDLYKTNHFNKALGYLEKSIKVEPIHAEPEARFWLGAAYAALGRPVDAIREYRRAAELRPKDIEVLYQVAALYDQQGSSLFERIGTIEPRAAAVSLLQAERLLAENRASLAVIEYRRAITLRPDLKSAIPSLEQTEPAAPEQSETISGADARACGGLAAYWRVNGQTTKSDELFAHLSKLVPADDVARKYVISAQSPSLRVNLPDDTRLWSQLQQVSKHLQAGDYRLAETLLQELLDGDPRNIDGLLALGKTYKRWAESILERMTAINPDAPRVHQLQGEREEAKGNYEGALQSYRTALDRQPNQPGLAYAIGNVYWKLHQYDDAEVWLGKELSQNPHHGLAHYRLGSLYTEQGKSGQAIAHLTEALAAHPEWVDARFDFGRALSLAGRQEEAVAQFRKVAADGPPNDRVHYLLSNALRRLGRNEEADSEMARYQDLTRKRLERTQRTVRDFTDSRETGNTPEGSRK